MSIGGKYNSQAKYLILLLISLLPHLPSFAQMTERSLGNQHWEFRNIKEDRWFTASVPGNIYTDLLANNLIPDPFYGTNEEKVQWVDSLSWEYRTRFTLSSKELKAGSLFLSFDGLDTYAEVFLNGFRYFTSSNMFIQTTLYAGCHLKVGENEIRILFSPALEKSRQKASLLPYTLPGEERVHARKAQYQFGWDWGPRLIGCGIWKDIRLITLKNTAIQHIETSQKHYGDSLVILQTDVSFFKPAETIGSLNATLSNGSTLIQAEKIVLKGDTQARLVFTIPSPKLWWSNGMGNPELYRLKISLISENRILHTKELDIGLRTFEWVQENDSIGTSFFMKLNGVPVFCKGANQIPADFFPHRVSTDDYERLIQAAADANMNMLRVWGGGIYESDAFYEICSRKGILVWQDFMFACAMYPGDAEFLNSVAKEATQQLIRLRNHACIALWCGNNENIEGWYNWGWQKQYNLTESDSLRIIRDYDTLFHEILPNLVNKYAPAQFYHPSSPANGWGRDIAYREADVHYWGVWWGKEPFETYRTKTGRFVSEYGFQALPAYESLMRFIPENQGYLGSPAMKTHQKHPVGYETIHEYMLRDYTIPDSLNDYVYVSQLLQARGIKTAIEAHRKAMPGCMGSLFWQFNDCWPVTSWSCIDYYGQPKALYYQAKLSFEPLLLKAEGDENQLDVFIVSELRNPINATLDLFFISFAGDTLYETGIPLEISPLTSRLYHSLNTGALIPPSYSSRHFLLRMELRDADALLSRENHYFVTPKNLELAMPTLGTELLADGVFLLRCSHSLAKDIFLSCPGFIFEPNFFDLLPGEEMLINAKPNPIGEFQPENLKIQHLYNIQKYE